MPEEAKKLIVDDDWKEQARREKERLAEQEAQSRRQSLPEASFADVINLVAIQAMVGLGLVAGPGGEPMPPQLDVARHFIDLLRVIAERTKNNLTPQEQRLLEQVSYDLQMRYVELATGAAPLPPGSPAAAKPKA